MPDFNPILSKIDAARKNSQKAGRDLYKAKLAAAKKQGLTQFVDAQKEIGAALLAQTSADAVLRSALGELFAAPKTYVALTETLDAQLPVLFFPVHLETRFFEPPAGGDRELLVRIYPDDIHVFTHEELMTPEEIKAGEQYWRNLAATERKGFKGDKTLVKKEAWKALRYFTGPQRCLWVARSTQPENWAALKPDTPENQIKFPSHPETKNHSWTIAPHTRLLPDKFVVSIHGPAGRVDVEGKVIPDTVYLGPDPFYADKAYEKLDDQIVPHADVAWMHDFDKAEESGMALRIPVQPGFFAMDQHGDPVIPKISVSGLLLSTDPATNQQMLEQLLENHYYSRRGFSFVAQGTPTNNTEQDGSGYSSNEDLQPKGYYEGVPSTLNPGSDGAQTAELLGISAEIIKEAPNAEMREQEEARQMNRALYPGTLGYYFGRHLHPTVTEAGADRIKSFFLENVSARGPLPAMRVGDQPYGILLTSDESRWQNNDDNFLKDLWKVLNALQAIWNQILQEGKVQHVGMPTPDPARLLIEVMGLQAGSVAYEQRLGYNHDYLVATTDSAKKANYYNAIQQQEVLIKSWLQSIGFPLPNFNTTVNPPVTSLYWDELTARLLDKNLVGKQSEEYLGWLQTVNKLETLEAQHFEGKAPNQLLYLLLRHALLLEMLDQTVHFYEKNGIKAKAVKANKSLFNLADEAQFKDVTQMELMLASPKSIDGQKFSNLEEKPVGDLLLQNNSTIPESESLQAIKAALAVLKNLPAGKLERYLNNHLDLCCYRLDAWQTGVFYQKLRKNRIQKPTGLYIGAYGWVTDLKAEAKKTLTRDDLKDIPSTLMPPPKAPFHMSPDNAGFIHTPSLNHASAMGLLLSGYNNYKKNYGQAADNQPFGVNLSSERMRRAKFIFEGVQNGQALDTLLGYQFERGLHDRSSADLEGTNLNQYIFDLREKYPVKRDNIPQQGSPKVLETLSAYPVVSGLLLLENLTEGEVNGLTIPANPGNPTRAAHHTKAIMEELDWLANTLDAANDLMMAETAYQVVQGNNDRSTSVLNALKNAEIPPSLEVLKTPRTTSLGFTNRACLHFRTDMSGQAGNQWTNKDSPRSRMETGLNRWLGQCLGNPSTIVCIASFQDKSGLPQKPKVVTLADLEVQPIDFVMIVGGDHKNSLSELEGRIANAYRTKAATDPTDALISIQLGAGADSAEKRSFAQVIPLARALRTLATTARPATALDFEGQRRSTNNVPVSRLHGYDVADLTTRAQVAINDLQAKAFFIKGKQPNETDPAAPASFEAIFESFYDDGKNPGHFDNIVLSENGLRHIYRFLRDASLYGINLAYPDDVTGAPEPELLAKAASIWKLMGQKLAAAQEAFQAAATAGDDYAKVEQLRKATKTALGDDMPVIPRFRYNNGADVKQSVNDQKQLLKYICSVESSMEKLALESWMQSAVHVRPELEKLERVRILVEAVGGHQVNIDAAQTPYRPKDSWLAVELPERYEGDNKPFYIKEDTICLALFGEAFNETELLQSALVVDEWAESIPSAKEMTGIAYHYNQPNAVPPQTLLLAVEPTGSSHWTWETLQGVLENTFHRAKTRAVEPAQFTEHDLLKHLLPMTIADFDALQANVSLDYAVASDEFLQNSGDARLYEPYKP